MVIALSYPNRVLTLTCTKVLKDGDIGALVPYQMPDHIDNSMVVRNTHSQLLRVSGLVDIMNIFPSHAYFSFSAIGV